MADLEFRVPLHEIRCDHTDDAVLAGCVGSVTPQAESKKPRVERKDIPSKTQTARRETRYNLSLINMAVPVPARYLPLGWWVGSQYFPHLPRYSSSVFFSLSFLKSFSLSSTAQQLAHTRARI